MEWSASLVVAILFDIFFTGAVLYLLRDLWLDGAFRRRRRKAEPFRFVVHANGPYLRTGDMNYCQEHDWKWAGDADEPCMKCQASALRAAAQEKT